MSQLRCLIVLVLVPTALPTLGTRRAGWLDRVVLYHKQKLFSELKELAPIQISAEIQQKPVGYVDSTQWDYDSVQRLLTLISASETAKPVHKALRRMLQPTRRLMMSMKESKQRFPSIKPENNEFYYDGYSSAEEHELPAPPPVPEDQVVLVVSNPVEARLPSARISVKLLRDILEARARAARQMPTPKNKPWLDFIRNRTRFSSTTKLDSTGTDKVTPKTGDATPKTDDATPKTDDATPKTNDTTPKIDDATPETNDTTPKTGDATPETDEANAKTGNGTLKTDNGTLTTENGTLTTNNGTLTTNNGTLTTNNGTLTTNNGTVTTNNGTPETK